ncbi:sodium/potassium/calcium exchanger 4-like [Zeugodacus cucurbitae]|uniref:sodium/potassium/calcium exchanger 4-like n=1 Tax=Zeugodacus cucurbitae TaxID=28588 RepID=UPI0023D908C8|nr:sodium/potassium/calcium exchanger 4-like [Zeugodacus cucurbitae]
MMDENSTETSESRTFVKDTYVKTKTKNIRNHSKLWLQLRCCIYVGVILLFYTNYLWFDGGWRGRAEKVPPKQPQSTGRQLLSIVSTSAIDLEHSQEDVSITEIHYNNKYQRKHTNLDDSKTTTTKTAAESNTTRANSRWTADSAVTATAIANCTAPAILEFPTDGLTRAERQHGWITLHILLALYCFWLLAVICDDYFLPAIELICQALQMRADVVGATFMAVATSSPELFMNCVGTFVTKGDIGIGTIVGSSVFNLLAVPACCGLFVGQCVRLDWWPVSRDCLMYCLAVIALICTLWDGKVMWYESMMLFLAYFFYMAVMYYNDKVARSARRLISRYRRKLRLVFSYREVGELTPLIRRQHTFNSITNYTLATSFQSSSNCASSNNLATFYIPESSTQLHPSLEDVESCRSSTTHNDSCSWTVASEPNCVNETDYNATDYADTPWERGDASWLCFLLRWPITFLLYITVPDSRRHPQAKYLTFVAAIMWIALISYVVAYAITVIGDTLNIPDSVMGLTILSAGMSVPEAVSSIIVTKQGLGAMGISNAIGSNTFDILLCLSVPWFVKAYFLPNHPDEMWVAPRSNGLTYSVIFLLASVICLFLTLLLNRFKLDRKVGLICAILYVCFIVCAALIELNVFFPVNLPVCEH